MFLQQLVNGLTVGCTYALVAVGFSMVYGVLQLVNFAHGAFYLVGVYMMITLYVSMSLGLLPALLLALTGTGLLGALMDRVILKPIRNRSGNSGVASLIATLGMGTCITNLLIVLFGSETKSFPNILDFGKFYLGGAIVRWNQVLIALITIAMMSLLSLIVYHTKMGTAMRAISQNPQAAQLMGIPVDQVIMITFFIGTVCAAVSGVLVAMYYASIDTAMYMAVSLKTFASAVLGGIGSLPGAMIGGVLIGVLETLVAGYISSDYREAVAFIILIAVLLLKPSGLLGQKQAEKV